MAKAHLYYFNFHGLGEPIRYLLHYGNEDFIDERLTFEMFATKKPNLPLGKLPCLEIDGLELHQSMAICRYLAKKYNILGKTDVDAVYADMIIETLNDIRIGLQRYYSEKDEKVKESKKEVTFKDLKMYMEKLENTVKNNDGTMVKGQLTYADIVFAGIEPGLSLMSGKDITADYPSLRALVEKVRNTPGIKKYIDSHKLF